MDESTPSIQVTTYARQLHGAYTTRGEAPTSGQLLSVADCRAGLEANLTTGHFCRVTIEADADNQPTRIIICCLHSTCENGWKEFTPTADTNPDQFRELARLADQLPHGSGYNPDGHAVFLPLRTSP